MTERSNPAGSSLRHRRRVWIPLAAVAGVVTLCAVGWRFRRSFYNVTRVPALVQTEPVPGDRDYADDPAIWVHPTRPELSLVIGTDKSPRGGLRVYNLMGKQLQFVGGEGMNNVDLRYGFVLGDKKVDLVAATNTEAHTIALFVVDPATRRLRPVAARAIRTRKPLTGCCLYRSARTGKFYFFGNSLDGEVEQWELFDNGKGRVDARLVRQFDVGSRTEGCVADDELGRLYISEEHVAIWRYGAEPDAGETRTAVDRAGRNLHPDIEGLTLYYAPGGKGYLIASSQNSDWFSVYERAGDNRYVTKFRIVGNHGIGGCQHTDGIDVTNAPLGGRFPKGLFVAHDGRPRHDTNFKLVPWDQIAGATEPKLLVDTRWDPRRFSVAARPRGAIQ